MIGGKEEAVITVRRRSAAGGVPSVSRTFERGPGPKPAHPPNMERVDALVRRLGGEPLEVCARINGALRSVMARNRRVRPSFSETFVAPQPPTGAEERSSHAVGSAKVRLFTIPNETEGYYLLEPTEYRLPTAEIAVMEEARRRLLEEAPEDLRVDTPAQVRAWVERRGEAFISEAAARVGLALGNDRTEERARVRELASILGRYTAGLGVLEHLLMDPMIQDVFVDAPADANPVYVLLGNTGGAGVPNRCRTNIRLSEGEVEGLVSRLRHASGRPFSEARPYLEHDLEDLNARATVIGRPLSPSGTAIAFRRHSSSPWTLPKLVAAGSMPALAAGLLSFLVDGQSTVLIAGGRGSGKTSLLGAMLQGFPRSQRILTIEDTLELPVEEMQTLGYKVQAMRVQSTLGTQGELTAQEALRLALRLGDSAIVLGEVRGEEAKTLYEAMRTGNAGSSVLGTIHGNSSRAVFDRVVHDLGISGEAFRATDVVVVTGLRRPGGAQRQVRRVVEVSEVDKSSASPGHFTELMRYDDARDGLREQGLEASSRIRAIADSWGLTVQQAVENIRARGQMVELMVELSRKANRPELLEPEWVAEANNALWSLVDEAARKGDRDFVRLADDWARWWEEVTRDG